MQNLHSRISNSCGQLILCLVLIAAPVYAQGACKKFESNQDDIWTSLQDRVESQCFSEEINAWKKDNLGTDAKIVAGWDQIKTRLLESRATVNSFEATMGEEAKQLDVPVSYLIARTEFAIDELRNIGTLKPFSRREPWVVDWRTIGGLPAVSIATAANTQNTVRAQDEGGLAGPLGNLCVKEAELANTDTCPRVSEMAASLMFTVSLALELGAASGVDTINRIASLVASVDDEWDKFLLKGKPMYWLDLLATDFFADYKESKGGFKRPPEFQVFFLHPSPALSYIKDAPDGDQLVPSIYLEIIGVNKWRSTGFTGASLIAAYSDNASTDDVGYGVSLTWNSKYTIGLVDHDGDSAISISIDLADAYREKLKPQLEELKLGL